MSIESSTATTATGRNVATGTDSTATTDIENSALQIINLSKIYSDFRLDRINLNLPLGYIMGLIG